MQELLGRITALDPSASLGIRVIACFDELIVGQVNTHGLLAAAAALAGCPAGLRHRDAVTRVSPMGEPIAGPAATDRVSTTISEDLTVWLERDGNAQVNDAIILERLALAIRIRFAGSGADRPVRDVHTLVDADAEPQQRRQAGVRLGLSPTSSYRVVAAPLFAQWTRTASWPSDVVTTAHGTLHILIAPASTSSVAATPSGLGIVADLDGLARSMATAVVALRLCRPPGEPSVCADAYGGLIDILADSRSSLSTDPIDGTANPDVAAVDSLMGAPWAESTVEAILTSATIRQAARNLGVHHSTMQSRLENLRTALGFEPLDGYGKARLGVAYLLWRLHHSRVLDLPAPGSLGSGPSARTAP